MSTIELKSSLHNLIDTINDSKTLKAIYTLLKKNSAASKTNQLDWDSLSDAEKKAIDKAIKQADNGELIPHDQVMKELKTKYKFLK